jgi:hypothetical protein
MTLTSQHFDLNSLPDLHNVPIKKGTFWLFFLLPFHLDLPCKKFKHEIHPVCRHFGNAADDCLRVAGTLERYTSFLKISQAHRPI